jgi:hypothetical protein
MQSLMKVIEILAFIYALISAGGVIACISKERNAKSVAELLAYKVAAPKHLQHCVISLVIGLVIWAVLK